MKKEESGLLKNLRPRINQTNEGHDDRRGDVKRQSQRQRPWCGSDWARVKDRVSASSPEKSARKERSTGQRRNEGKDENERF